MYTIEKSILDGSEENAFTIFNRKKKKVVLAYIISLG